jgi:hypothetical protein
LIPDIFSELGESSIMKRAAILGPVALLLQSGPTAAADGPRILPASSDWALDFAEERCSLIREFGEGDDKIRLQIDAFGPSHGYRVMLSGGLVPGSDAARMTELRVGYSPDSAERERFTLFVGKFGEDNAVSFGRGFLPDLPQPAADPAGAFQRSVTHMTLEFKLRKPLQLNTGSMAAPFAAMHRCVDDLIASWGIDPTQHRARSRPPLVALTDERGERAFRATEQGGEPVLELFEQAGEPATERAYTGAAERRARTIAAYAYRSGERLPVRVMIDAAGQPTACVVQVAVADEAVRQKVCGRLKGPYQPALDAAGQPMASFVQVEL